MAQKILVIDDSPSIRTIVRLYLTSRPLEFLEATDGAQGLKIAEERGVDLVVADLNMPVMNGLEFVKAIRAHPKEALRVLPILLLTGSKEASDRQASLDAGASAFAVKPISKGELTATVERLLGPLPGSAPR